MTDELRRAAGKLRDYGAGMWVGFLTEQEINALTAAGAKPCWNSRKPVKGQPWYCRLPKRSAIDAEARRG